MSRSPGVCRGAGLVSRTSISSRCTGWLCVFGHGTVNKLSSSVIPVSLPIKSVRDLSPWGCVHSYHVKWVQMWSVGIGALTDLYSVLLLKATLCAKCVSLACPWAVLFSYFICSASIECLSCNRYRPEGTKPDTVHCDAHSAHVIAGALRTQKACPQCWSNSGVARQ